jgi:transitional endoplasmic reticulum ATPase
MEALVKSTEGMVGADLEGLCRQAALFAIREMVLPAEPGEAALRKLKITKRHFEMALAERAASRSRP